MYDRAPRTINFTIGCTPEHVGPGSYDHRRLKMNEESYAPFLSLSNRGEIFPNDENPGPGQYDLRTDRSLTIKGGSTLANRATRFEHKLPDDTPGPGTYELNASESARSTATDAVKHPRQNIFRYNRKSLPPSIPEPKFAYGFEEDDAGKLVPQLPPNRDASLGPAFYHSADSVENATARFYRGVHFSKYSSKRTDFSGRQGPGPSDYNPSENVKLEIQHMNLKTLDKRQELQIPRYPEDVLQRATKDSVPGPGQYTIRRELDPLPSKIEITGLDYERPAFGSQTNRFDVRIPDVPGPASYDDKILTAFNASQTKPTSFRRTPFNQTATRFVMSDYKARTEPGPGQYRIPGFTDESLRRALIEDGKKPPFNVATTRRFNITRKDEFYTPGPSSYDIKTQFAKPKVDQPSANFLSNTSREPIIEETPGPHSYDVPRAYQALTSQHRQPPRSKNARKRHTQFLSAAKRTSFIDPNAENPGPASYDTFLSPRTYGYAPVHEARFRHEAQIIPGPADYELSPLLQDTVLRGTFNTSLNNPILAKLQSRAIREEKAAADLTSTSVVMQDLSTE